MPVYGTDIQLAICFQNSYNTVGDITNSAQSIAVINESFNAQQPLMASENLRNRVDRGDAYAGAKEVTGEIEFEVVPKSIGYLLRTCLNRTSSVQSDSLYNHTFQPETALNQPNSPMRPVTVMKRIPNGQGISTNNYYNLNASGIEFSCEAGGFLKAKVPFIGGRNDNAQVDITPSYPTDDPFTFDQCSFTIGGNAVDYIKSFTVSIDESLETKHTLCDSGDHWPNRVVRGGFRTGTINCTLSFDNSSEYIAFRGDAASPPPLGQIVTARFTQPVEPQSGYPYTFLLYMPKVKWESFEAPTQGAGEIEVSLTGRLKYDNSAGYMFSSTLINTQSAY